MSKEMTAPRPIMRWVIIGLILVTYLGVTNPHPDFTRFNAHDSGSYMALSYNLIHGNGYTRNIAEGQYIPHTLWPPGMATLLAPAIALSGETVNWLAVKMTMITVGLIGLVLLWKYLVRIGEGDSSKANVVTLFVALNPYYWHFSRVVLAEVPVVVWIIGALYVIDRVWAKRELRCREAALCGVFVGIGMLIKGSVLGLVECPRNLVQGYEGRDWVTESHSLCRFDVRSAATGVEAAQR
ncbi:glycosyltransferase family 39 protein, partial [Stieleria bergensis]